MKYLLIVLSLATMPGCSDEDQSGERLYSVMESAPPILAQRPEQKRAETTRKLVTTGSISFEVDKLEEAHQSIDSLVKTFGAYITSDQRTDLTVNQQLRIPADKLDDFVSKIAGIATEINSRDFYKKDVTEEFMDDQSRLVTKKELEKRYRELLRLATKVEEMLKIEEQLEIVRGDIESMEGRLQYITSQVAYSRLTLTYSEPIVLANRFAFWSEFGKSFSLGWHNLELFLLQIINQWPFIITGIGAFIVAYRWIRKRLSSFRKSPVEA
jgi:hypothetical protein